MTSPPVIPVLLSVTLIGSCAGKVGAEAPDGGGADGPAQGASAPAGHDYCPGVERPPAGTITCLDRRECPDPQGYGPARCATFLRPIRYGCGGGALIPPLCTEDSGCPAGQICRIAQCERFNSCEAACTPQSCGSGADCVNGHCVRKRCDQPGGACETDWTCRPGPDTAAAYGCAPNSCREGYRCPMPFDCNPGAKGADLHGCAVRPCQLSTDCLCGSCVEGICEVAPGVCTGEPGQPP
jgi:hypothetical protein